jgi:hypothetical protein
MPTAAETEYARLVKVAKEKILAKLPPGEGGPNAKNIGQVYKALKTGRAENEDAAIAAAINATMKRRNIKAAKTALKTKKANNGSGNTVRTTVSVGTVKNIHWDKAKRNLMEKFGTARAKNIEKLGKAYRKGLNSKAILNSINASLKKAVVVRNVKKANKSARVNRMRNLSRRVTNAAASNKANAFMMNLEALLNRYAPVKKNNTKGRNPFNNSPSRGAAGAPNPFNMF